VSQVISFKVTEEVSESVRMFLEAWEAVGSWKKGAGDFFELNSVSGESCHLYLSKAEISFQGQFSDDGLNLIEALASSHGAELFYEGELFNEAEQMEVKTAFKPQWTGSFKLENIGTMTKFKAVVIAIIAIPLVIILIPVAIVLMIVRLLFFIIFKGKGTIK